MNMVEIIEKKKFGQALSAEEIDYFVKGAADGSIPDYQLSALLMAIRLNGMNREETVRLTLSMAHSGDMMDLSMLKGVPTDKHSTGGVGDTTSLVLAPLVAACGVPVAKMSGRGLGHTGGTLDKLESISGFRIGLSEEEFIRQVQDIGIAIIGQTKNLAPADKTLYALRDVTATVDSLPLIASSIVSKKLASGAQAIVLDVKTGAGALMHTTEASIELAQTMVRIGCDAGRRMVALVTDMGEPLGSHIGNALEVKEAIDVLNNRVEGPLLTVAVELGARMLLLGGAASSVAEGRDKLMAALHSGAGLEKLRQMIVAQGGDPACCDDVSQPAPGQDHPGRSCRGGRLHPEHGYHPSGQHGSGHGRGPQAEDRPHRLQRWFRDAQAHRRRASPRRGSRDRSCLQRGKRRPSGQRNSGLSDALPHARSPVQADPRLCGQRPRGAAVNNVFIPGSP